MLETVIFLSNFEVDNFFYIFLDLYKFQKKGFIRLEYESCIFGP